MRAGGNSDITAAKAAADNIADAVNEVADTANNAKIAADAAKAAARRPIK